MESNQTFTSSLTDLHQQVQLPAALSSIPFLDSVYTIVAGSSGLATVAQQL